MYLTADMLREKDACEDQVTIFEEEWPDGVEVTVEAILRAVELWLDIDWFVHQFLPAPVRKAYNEAMTSAQRAYDEVIAPAQKAYDEGIASARKAYDEVVDPARKAYNEVIASTRKAYNEVIAPTWKVYDEGIAFAEQVYRKDQALALYKALKEL